ncbi:MAG: alginate lyase family protein [Armatimonadota bacterium]
MTNIFKKIIDNSFNFSKSIIEHILHAVDKKNIKKALSSIEGKFDKIFIYQGELSEYIRARKNVKFFYDFANKEDILNILKSRFKGSLKEHLGEADDAVTCKFKIKGHESVFFGAFIDWFAGFKGDKWKQGYYREINKGCFTDAFDHEAYAADFNFSCELNKLHHLVELGKAYYITGEEKYAESYFKHIEDWIDKNPYKIGANWTQNIVVAQRSVNIIFSLFFFLNNSNFPEQLLKKIMSSLYLHAKFIYKHIDDVAGCGAHLIGSASALYFLSYVFPEFKESLKWRKKSLKILMNEANEQVYSDGVNYESSTGRHRYVAEFFLLPVLIMYLNNDNNYRKLASDFKLEKMLEFIMYMTQPRGSVQPISDTDGRRVWRFNNVEANDYTSYLALGTVVFERSDFKAVSAGSFEEVVWFLGKDGYDKYAALNVTAPSQASVIFPEGGYCVLRDGWDTSSSWLFFDIGFARSKKYIDERSFSAHNHSDILNFGFSKGVDVFFTDSGAFIRPGANRWYDYFRASAQHNVMIVNGMDVCASGDTVKAKLIKWESDPVFDHIIASHDGYKEMGGGIVVIREIIFDKQDGIIIIKDRVEGEGEHNLSLFMHLHPDIKVKRLDDREDFELTGKANKVFMKIFSDNFHTTVEKSFYSPDYGIKVPSKKIAVRKRTELPVQIHTFINLRNKSFRESLLELDDKYL